jgi:hypothetical protein
VHLGCTWGAHGVHMGCTWGGLFSGETPSVKNDAASNALDIESRSRSCLESAGQTGRIVENDMMGDRRFTDTKFPRYGSQAWDFNHHGAGDCD